MALPGFADLPGLVSRPEELPASEDATTIDLPEGGEYRFEVGFDEKITISVLSGHAEIYGTELAIQQPYSFSGIKACIYTHPGQGCSLSIAPEPSTAYSESENPHMTAYVNLHFALEALRNDAVASLEASTAIDDGLSNGEASQDGPRVLIVGPDDAGKTSLAKLLTAYAIKMDRQPVVIGLDPKESILAVPGSLSMAQFAGLMDVEQGWGCSPISGPSEIPMKLPLLYPFLLQSPEQDPKLFKAIIRRMALALQGRFADEDAMVSGCIIDTPGVFAQGKGGYDLIQHCVSELNVDVILTLGSERLFSEMNKRFAKVAAVVKLPKSGGCVERDDEFIRKMQEKQLREYFFGDTSQALSSHVTVVDYADLQIWQYSKSAAVLSSLLPGGADDVEESSEVMEEQLFTRVSPGIQMQNYFLAILNVDLNQQQETLRDATIMGWLYVIEADEANQKLRVLAPIAGRLPTKSLLWGKWPEAVVSLAP